MLSPAPRKAYWTDMAAPDLLRLDSVSVRRGATLALDRVSLRIPQGQHVAVLGPNGSGKSTLLKLLTREIYPLNQPGSRIEIFGESAWNIFELRSRLGIVSPDLLRNHVRHVSGRDLITSSFFTSVGLWFGDQPTEEMTRRADELARQFGIEATLERPLHAMSSGEARRCLLARALVHRPHTLVLDEPTTSLDLRGRRDFLDLLAGLADGGHSLLMVTHHIGEILPAMDRVILLREGRIFADGPKPEMLRAEVLTELFGVPVAVHQRGGYYAAG